MSQEPHSEHRTKSRPNTEFPAMGKAQIEQFAKAQSELLDHVRHANQQWMERLQHQADSASKLATQLAAAKSIPEAVSIYREWTIQQLEIMANDGKHLLDDTQKLIGTSARLLLNGGISNWSGVSS
jgi:Phasin protein